MITFCVARTLPVLSALLCVVLALTATPAFAYSHHAHAADSIHNIGVAELPFEARETLRLIRQDGTFPYLRDGAVFGNYEKRLPKKQRGYYHEYTVKTPGARNRGARRIVCGQPSECYYSDDHYQSFKLIRQ